MLRVTIELFPHGDVADGRILKQIFVRNDGTGTASHGNYVVYADGMFDCAIKRHPRILPVTHLIAKALKKIIE